MPKGYALLACLALGACAIGPQAAREPIIRVPAPEAGRVMTYDWPVHTVAPGEMILAATR